MILVYLEKSQKAFACDKATGDTLLNGPPHTNRSEVSEIKVADETAWVGILRRRDYTRRI